MTLASVEPGRFLASKVLRESWIYTLRPMRQGRHKPRVVLDRSDVTLLLDLCFSSLFCMQKAPGGMEQAQQRSGHGPKLMEPIGHWDTALRCGV